MTDPLDHDLALLARPAPPAALDDLEHRVALAIAAGGEAGGTSGPGLAMAAVGAMLLGLAGGAVMSARSEARAQPERIAVVLDAGLAPSTLLLGR